MNTHLPQVHFDWTINVTNLITILFFIGTAIAGWYSLKSEVDVNKNTSELRFQTVDRELIQQGQINAGLNQKIDATSQDLKNSLRDSTADIKADIRALQEEVIKSEVTRRG